MGTAAHMTRVRVATNNAFTEPPSTAPPPQLAAPIAYTGRRVRDGHLKGPGPIGLKNK